MISTPFTDWQKHNDTGMTQPICFVLYLSVYQPDIKDSTFPPIKACENTFFLFFAANPRYFLVLLI